jgi:hypothetical protein
MNILQVGPLHGSCLPDAAVSAGPFLEAADFAAHPINGDPSLGSRPPFTDRRMARLVLYQDPRGWTHLWLFDGRPGSRWGCFLDPGQTARICLTGPDGLTSYGNRHYLQWPGNTTGRFTWVPGTGRPVSSIITVRPGRTRIYP